MASGCGTGPPGGGLTNVEPPLRSEEKPAMRDDLPAPSLSTGGEAPADAAASSPSAPGTNAGTGGRNGGQGGTQSPSGKADTKGADDSSAPAPRSSPPKLEQPTGAQGETKPPGNIQEGTPRSPQ
jgi:hypothetical protein